MSTPKYSSAMAIGVYRASVRPKYTGLPGREVQKLPKILLLFAEFLPVADGHTAARQPAILPVSSLQVSLNVERFSGR
jgi:hypothetical protein